MVDCVELGDEIAGLAVRLNVATHRLLCCIRQFDQLARWHEQGAQSCAHWLTWRVGLDPGAAREKVRVARSLGELPKIDSAFATGRLSYSKVRAITRVATPANEERVLEVALATTGAQLERICRGYRRATELELEASRDRYVRARPLGDGLVKLEIVVAADEAELVLKAIEHTRQGLSPANDSTPRPSAADALIQMASLQLAGGEASAGAPAPDRCQVVIHVDRDLTAPEATLRAELEDGTHFPRKRFGAYRATEASCRRPSMKTARFSTSGAARARYQLPFGARSGFATRDADSLAARMSDFFTGTTSSTGCTEAVRRSTTWSCSARSITGKFTRAASRSD